MAISVRPRRSVLYMPGSNERALAKAKTLAADTLILDLEDAVAPDVKPAARGQVVAAVQAGGYGKRELIIRVNGLGTPWGKDDFIAAAGSGADGILLPKVESAADIHAALGTLDGAGAPPEMALWCMMETPRAILRAADIAAASDRVAGFVMGTNDLVKDIGAQHTPMRLPLITALGLCMLAARAHDIAIIDGVYNEFKDIEGFTAACRQGLEMGFDGKTLIHPGQVAPCNAVFSPSPEQVAFARKIATAFAEAQAAGKAVVVVDGRMIENLHVEQGRRLLALAEAIAELEQAS